MVTFQDGIDASKSAGGYLIPKVKLFFAIILSNPYYFFGLLLVLVLISLWLSHIFDQKEGNFRHLMLKLMIIIVIGVSIFGLYYFMYIKGAFSIDDIFGAFK